jgi:hypothetical protein
MVSEESAPATFRLSPKYFTKQAQPLTQLLLFEISLCSCVLEAGIPAVRTDLCGFTQLCLRASRPRTFKNAAAFSNFTLRYYHRHHHHHHRIFLVLQSVAQTT